MLLTGVSGVALAPEDELLLCCARVGTDTEKAAQLKALLQHDIDWVILLCLARRHGMTPLLYWHLHTMCPEVLPEELMGQLRDTFHNNIRYNLSLTGELLALIRLFAAYQIPVVSYKGPVLAVTAYGNLALRQFSDLDVLVHQQDFQRLKDLLLERGYQPAYQLTQDQEASYLDSQGGYSFGRDGIWVDVHCNVMPQYFAFESGDLWQRLTPVAVSGQEILTFALEDALLILCMHGTKHFWSELRWLCDVARLISVHQDMDWEWVMQRATSIGSKRALFHGLSLAHELLAAPLPAHVQYHMQSQTALRLPARQVYKQLFQEAYLPPGVLQRLVYFHRTMDSAAAWRKYIIGAVTTPNPEVWALWQLPPLLLPLYYVLRPLQLLGKYTRRLVQHLYSGV